MTVAKRAFVPFSIRNNYKDKVWCDVVSIDAGHILLGRPWGFDRDVVHDDRKNTYSFMFSNIKITLLPTREQFPKRTQEGGIHYFIVNEKIYGGGKGDRNCLFIAW